MTNRWVARAAAVIALAITAGAGALFPVSAAAAAPSTCGDPKVASEQLGRPSWALQRLRPEQAWSISRGAGITVAVIDSGVSNAHPKLSGAVIAGHDYLDPKGDGTCDNFGHGTLVASLIAGSDKVDTDPSVNAKYEFFGIAPDAKILPLKVFPNGDLTTDAKVSGLVADAIRYAVQQRARVINMSLFTAPSDALESAINYAYQNDVVLVAAAGNTGGSKPPVFPASYDHVIAVASIGEDGARVSTSSTGPNVALAAPGDRVPGATPLGRGYVFDDKGGTSFASAFVAGTAALILARDPKLSVDAVRRQLLLTADAPPGGRNDQVGAGVVNPYRAVSTILASEDTRLPDPPALAPIAADPDADFPLRAVALAIGVVGVAAAFVLLVIVPMVRGLAAALPQPAAPARRGRTGRVKRARPPKARQAAAKRPPPAPVAGTPAAAAGGASVRPVTAVPAQPIPAAQRTGAPPPLVPSAPGPAGYPASGGLPEYPRPPAAR